MLRLIDGNGWYRRMIETDKTGLPLRTAVMDIQSDAATTVVVWDGAGGNARRRAIYPRYKSGRKPMDPGIFKTLNLFKDLFKFTKAIQVQVPGREGDDVLACLAAAYAPQTAVSILTIDGDIHALGNIPGVRVSGPSDPKCPLELIRLYKATKGDTSDTVSGIKGFGDKAWEGCNKSALLDWYQRGGVLPPDSDAISKFFDMPKACASWLLEHESEARAAWEVVGFMPPSMDELGNYLIPGTPNDAAVNQILKEFMQ